MVDVDVEIRRFSITRLKRRPRTLSTSSVGRVVEIRRFSITRLKQVVHLRTQTMVDFLEKIRFSITRLKL